MKTSLAILVALALCACTSNSTDAPAGGSGGDAATVPYAPTPDSDPFYAQPDPMPDLPPGTILKSRTSSFTPTGGIPLPYPAWQIQYVSMDVNDRPQAVVATVVKPLIPSLTSPAPLLVYLMAYDSLGSNCTPSHTLNGDNHNGSNELEGAFYLQALATQGWPIVFPDYEGPYSEYGAGVQAGRATLDAARAALQFPELGLSGNSPVGLWGYSGGALAAGWAASLQESYAPELNIRAIASGGTPTNTFNIVKQSQNGSYFNLVASAVVGTNRAYPELFPPGFLNETGEKWVQTIKDGCNGQTTDGSTPPFATFQPYTTVPDPFETPGAKAVAAKTLLPQPGLTPIADVYVYHAIPDQLLPIEDTDTMVQTWCAGGAHVSYFRDPLGQDHVSGFITGADFALAYLVSRLNGLPLTVLPPGAQVCN